MSSSDTSSDIVPALIALIGEPYEAPAVTALLARLPKHVARKPSGYDQYIVSKAGGFDLLFTDAGAKVGGRWHRTLHTIFLYNEGAEGHRRFTGTLPLGMTFDDSRAQLIGRRAPSVTWKMGEGKMPIDCPDPTFDGWTDGGVDVSVFYAGAAIHRLQISRLA